MRENPKDRLINLVSTRIMTTMIGSIAALEKCFDLVWVREGGYYDILENGARKENLTPQEEEFLDRFEEVREKILNYGNNQKRGIIHEINEYYQIEQKTFHTTFQVKE